mmetsp:Transcript_66819/g.164709  ORF Transcript_66819/g.164709 Transcript_66819/m.164709 type:complete len:251 (-) Transcript_66819:291-1043(-)
MPLILDQRVGEERLCGDDDVCAREQQVGRLGAPVLLHHQVLVALALARAHELEQAEGHGEARLAAEEALGEVLQRVPPRVCRQAVLHMVLILLLLAAQQLLIRLNQRHPLHNRLTERHEDIGPLGGREEDPKRVLHPRIAPLKQRKQTTQRTLLKSMLVDGEGPHACDREADGIEAPLEALEARGGLGLDGALVFEECGRLVAVVGCRLTRAHVQRHPEPIDERPHNRRIRKRARFDQPQDVGQHVGVTN